jgi:uncharacterized protein (TIGR03067 family)
MLNRCFLFALLAALGFGLACMPASRCAASEPNADESSGSQLDGSWKVESIAVGRETRDPQSGMPDVLEIASGVFNAKTGGQPIGTFSGLKIAIDSSANPKKLNLMRRAGDQVETLPCIFELKDGQLKIAMPLVPADKAPEDPLPRPKSFDTNDEPILVLTAKRSN